MELDVSKLVLSENNNVIIITSKEKDAVSSALVFYPGDIEIKYAVEAE